MLCFSNRTPIHFLLSPHLKKIEQGLSLGADLFYSPLATITMAFKKVGQRQNIEKSGRGVWIDYKQMESEHPLLQRDRFLENSNII